MIRRVLFSETRWIQTSQFMSVRIALSWAIFLYFIWEQFVQSHIEKKLLTMVSWFDTVSFSISLLITAIIGVDASHYMSVFMFEHVLRYDYLYRLTDVYCFLFCFCLATECCGFLLRIIIYVSRESTDTVARGRSASIKCVQWMWRIHAVRCSLETTLTEIECD